MYKDRSEDHVMERYLNLGGTSNIHSFEIAADSITVQFGGGGLTYRYSVGSAGASNIDEMKRLARSGRGLNTFINQVVRGDYEAKW
jgi:hypothetical protein